MDDRGFNEFSINGFERAQTELGVNGRMYVSKSADDYLPNLTAAVDDGHDLVVGIGFLIQPAIVEVATEATDVNCAGIDQFYGEEPECGGENQVAVRIAQRARAPVSFRGGGLSRRRRGGDDDEVRNRLDCGWSQHSAGEQLDRRASGRR